jgi:hypothetical protein
VGGTITNRAFIDVSGGDGTPGGDAQSPAVVFDGDGPDTDSATTGIVVNDGAIHARGGVTDGSGGDVLFDGRGPGGFGFPLPGFLDLSGNGSGTSGTFTGQ